VLGDGRLREPKLSLEVSDGALGREQEAQDGAPVGLGDDGEGRFHAGHIAIGAYARQAM
jgi:hypothetical protein